MNPGYTIAHYRVTAKLGEGGMGAVYQATDTKLGREVALKFLPDAFARDPERLLRFEREARLLASLNHPRVGAIYGLEHLSDGPPFLVLELVPGQALAERLEAGPLDLETTLPLAVQIAEALEAAHEKGIVHRDLKPANIKVTPEGNIKVLDFGLGKSLAAEAAATSASNSPTHTIEATRAGVVLGTAAYMSPEQARGKPTGPRSDIWSFGCVLYEMLTARRAFAGETVSDIVAGILRGEPDWQAAPAPLRPLLQRCLRKDPARRWHHMGDVRLELEELPAAPVAAASPARAPKSPRVAWVLAGLMTMVAVAATGSRWFRAAPSPPVQRFTIPLPASDPLSSYPDTVVAVSRDGARIAYVSDHEGVRRLLQRPMDQTEFKPVPDSTLGKSPVFSPDGAWLAFSADGKLKKAPVNGGPAQVICDAKIGTGGFSWDAPDSIVFSQGPQGIWKCPASGGTAVLVAKPESSQHQVAFLHPRLLPNHDVLFSIVLDSISSMDDAVLAVRTGNETRVVLSGGGSGRYLLPAIWCTAATSP